VVTNRRTLALLVAAATTACGHGSPPSPCPADGYPAPALRPAGCTPGPDWLAYAFTRQGDSSPAIFISRADGRCGQRVTTDGAFYGGPAFFKGGQKLIYASTRSGLDALYILDLVTGAETAVGTSYQYDFGPTFGVATLAAAAPAVSPDGATIAFEGSWSAFPGWSDVFTVPAAGGNVMRVTHDGIAATLPKWSGDGSLLYYLSYQTGAAELFSASPDGTAVAVPQVTSGSALSSRFDLSGDGRALVYARFSTTGTGLQPTELVAWDLATDAVRVISTANEADPAVDAGNVSVAVSRRSAAGGYDLYLLEYGSGAVKQQLTSCPGQAFSATFAR
jgi:TolB protein